jgi:hypothetical protein
VLGEHVVTEYYKTAQKRTFEKMNTKSNARYEATRFRQLKGWKPLKYLVITGLQGADENVV